MCHRHLTTYEAYIINAGLEQKLKQDIYKKKESKAHRLLRRMHKNDRLISTFKIYIIIENQEEKKIEVYVYFELL